MVMAVARLGDKFTDSDIVSTGSGDVFVNNLPITRLCDMTGGHGLPGHSFYPPVPIITASGSVFSNNLPIVRLGDKHAIHCDSPHPNVDCHDGVVATASGNVFSG